MRTLRMIETKPGPCTHSGPSEGESSESIHRATPTWSSRTAARNGFIGGDGEYGSDGDGGDVCRDTEPRGLANGAVNTTIPHDVLNSRSDLGGRVSPSTMRASVGGPKASTKPTSLASVGGPRLGRRRWQLLLESRTSLPKREETVRVREGAGSLGNVRRRPGDVGTGLRVCWGAGLELVHETSLAGC